MRKRTILCEVTYDVPAMETKISALNIGRHQCRKIISIDARNSEPTLMAAIYFALRREVVNFYVTSVKLERFHGVVY